jgi:hypothetical protein
LRTLAFGVLEERVWGAAWFAEDSGTGILVLDTGAGTQVLEAQLGDGHDDGWQVTADGVAVTVNAAGDPVSFPAEPGVDGGFAQLCRVQARLTADGADRQIEALGERGERSGLERADRIDSVRAIAAWFGEGEGVAVVAVRPRKHRGQEQDDVGAAILTSEEFAPIVDPRVSTTYTADGQPTRMTLELWSEDPESAPRRVAGEAVGQSAKATARGWSVQAQLLLCHSRGHDGAGVYLLARPA